jgi:hypothetical protein
MKRFLQVSNMKTSGRRSGKTPNLKREIYICIYIYIYIALYMHYTHLTIGKGSGVGEGGIFWGS